MKIKMHLLGTSIAVLLSVYAVTVYAGQEIKEHIGTGEADIIEPEIRYPEADGNQGYYKTCPDIYIFHRQADAVTRFEFLASDNTKKAGSLELMEGQTEECVYLEADNFKDGENILHVWMEKNPAKIDESEDKVPEENDTGGNPVKNDLEKDDLQKEDIMQDKNESPDEPEIVFEKEICFLLDTKKPDKVHFSYDKAIRDGSIFMNEPIELTVKSEDEGSGMEAIYYKTGDEAAKALTGSSGTIVLAPGFSGTVEAYAVDKAGNKSELSVSEKILCENTLPEIQIGTESSIEMWHSDPVKIHVKVSDPFLSSGLRSLKCYVQGEVWVHKENDYNTGVTNMEAGFTVDIPSEGGQGIPVIVEALDWAGNYHSESRQVYIDNTAPVIQSEGIHDNMIAGKSVKGKMIIQEENDLASAKMEIWKITSAKKRELLDEKEIEPEPLSGSQKLEWDVSFDKDGIYEINLTAKDRAGHESSQNYQVILDQTNPVIRYVDQMQGAYVPYFQWNYGKEEVVQDETDYSYDIFLDGMFYTTGKRITKEGSKILQIKAVDAAGNESTAEAVFQIDHTPPKIRIYDVEDGSSYDDTAAVSISVDGKGEYLKEISINSEKMKLDANCQIFTQSFQEPGDYQIQVLAEDLAGNQEKEQITFCIEEKKQLTGGVWKPITRIFRNVKEEPDQSEKQEAIKKEKSPAVWILILCFVMVIFAGVLRTKMGLLQGRKRGK